MIPWNGALGWFVELGNNSKLQYYFAGMSSYCVQHSTIFWLTFLYLIYKDERLYFLAIWLDLGFNILDFILFLIADIINYDLTLLSGGHNDGMLGVRGLKTFIFPHHGAGFLLELIAIYYKID